MSLGEGISKPTECSLRETDGWQRHGRNPSVRRLSRAFRSWFVLRLSAQRSNSFLVLRPRLSFPRFLDSVSVGFLGRSLPSGKNQRQETESLRNRAKLRLGKRPPFVELQLGVGFCGFIGEREWSPLINPQTHTQTVHESLHCWLVVVDDH